ncbi:MAG: hypothetical protein AB1449_12570 [Chloroflexota bacterium]
MAWLRRAHSFFEHGDGDWFLARRGGRVVGTIGVAVDHHANRHLNRMWGVFGFFEFVEDFDVFSALLDRARGWCRQRRLTHLMGPQSFGASDYPGFLVGRHDCSAALLEGHSPPYYLAFAERAGFKPCPDSIAYRASRRLVGDRLEFMPEKILRAGERVARNPRYGVRQAELEHFEREFQAALHIYNRSLATLPGFAPGTKEEFRRMVKDLLPVLHEDLVLFATVDGREVGFSLALPNLAEAFRCCGGLRYPWQYLWLWLGVCRIRGVSFKILAIEPEYWGLGLDGLMFARLIENCVRRGFEWMDMSLTGEDNPQTNKLAPASGPRNTSAIGSLSLRCESAEAHGQ